MLSGQERKEFEEMLRLCYRYAEAINVKGEPFPEEAVMMTLLLKQHLIIKELKQAMEKIGNKGEKKGVEEQEEEEEGEEEKELQP